LAFAFAHDSAAFMSPRSLPRKPVLIFDSGVGGLSVLERVRIHRPEARVIYGADNAGFPYGTKSEAELNARVPLLLGRLVQRYDPCLVVIACNTASTIALGAVRQALALPVVGTVPAIKPAAALSQSRIIGLLGTSATIRQPYVDQLIADFAADCTVIRSGSARLVELAEGELRDQSGAPADYAQVLGGLFSQPGGGQIDTVVLACTHFPLVRAQLQAAAPRPVNWVDSGDGIARRVVHWTHGMEWPAGQDIAVFTADNEGIDPLRPALQRFGLNRVEIL
jgi:glutamate racemase